MRKQVYRFARIVWSVSVNRWTFPLLLVAFIFTPQVVYTSVSHGYPFEMTAAREKMIRSELKWIAKYTNFDSDIRPPRIIIVESEAEMKRISSNLGGDILTMIRESLTRESSARHVLTLLQVSLGLMNDSHWHVLAFYNPFSETIYIKDEYEQDKDFRRKNPAVPFYKRPRWTSILVHELVHYMQYKDDWGIMSCSGIQELQAYRLERQWMVEQTSQTPRHVPYKRIIKYGCWM